MQILIRTRRYTGRFQRCQPFKGVGIPVETQHLASLLKEDSGIYCIRRATLAVALYCILSFRGAEVSTFLYR